MKTLSTPANWQPRLREVLASSSPSARVALVGVGSPMRGDDYVGSFIAKVLMDEIGVGNVVVFDAEDGVEWIISKIAKSGAKHVILIDSCEMNTSAGRVALMLLSETDYPFFTTHGIPLKLLAGKFLPHAETWILAIQPDRMEFDRALSPAVLAAANSISNFIALALKESA